jgi:rare lipoprotein A
VDNSLRVVARVNDRGPDISSRLIDVSPRAAAKLDLTSDQAAPCRVEILEYPLIETDGPEGPGESNEIPELPDLGELPR